MSTPRKKPPAVPRRQRILNLNKKDDRTRLSLHGWTHLLGEDKIGPMRIDLRELTPAGWADRIHQWLLLSADRGAEMERIADDIFQITTVDCNAIGRPQRYVALAFRNQSPEPYSRFIINREPETTDGGPL